MQMIYSRIIELFSLAGQVAGISCLTHSCQCY